MKTITLKNVDILNLQAEIANVIENSKSFTAKFHLNNLLSQIEPKVKNFNELKNEMVKKYGTEKEDGQIAVQQFVVEGSSEETEEYKEFLPQWNDLLFVTDVEIEYTSLKLSVFDSVESDKYYPVLFKFIKE